MLARHRWITITIALSGTLASLSLAWLQWSIIDLQRELAVNEEIRDTWDAVRSEIKRAEDLQDTVVAFFEATEHVGREQFEAFAAGLPSVNFQAISFAAYVPAAEREDFERSMGAGTELASRIWEQDSEGRSSKAAARDAYLPVKHLYPAAGNRRALGFDLLSEPRRRRALLEAIRTGTTVRTDPVRLVQDPEQWAFLVFKPVYVRNRHVAVFDVSPPRPLGVVSAVYVFGSLLEAAVKQRKASEQQIALFDSAEPSLPVFLHNPVSITHDKRDLQRPLKIVASLPGARSVSMVAMHHEISAVFFTEDSAATWWREINATLFATLMFGLFLTAGLVWHHDRAYRLTVRLRKATEDGRLLKEEAERASIAKSRVLAAASHDLRQPVHAAALFIDSLKHSQLDERQQRTVDYLDQSVGSVRDLLNGLLDISKLDAGAVSPRFETFGVHELLAGIETEFASQAHEKGLRLTVHYPRQDILVKSDPSLVVTILRNLVSNAVMYTLRGGILVGARRHADHVTLQVWDTGIGIHEDHLERIYEEFYQIDNPHRDGSKGFGIGLAIARRAAGLLDCRLNCVSRVGRGTLFELVLPYDHDGRIVEAVPVVSAATDALAGKHVVVVEDNILVAESLASWLEEGGGFVSRYVSAEDALADEGAVGADCYISDHRLPGSMDGIEFLEAMRERAGHDITGIVVTGDTSPAFIERARRSGWRVLFKPVDPRLLLEALVA